MPVRRSLLIFLPHVLAAITLTVALIIMIVEETNRNQTDRMLGSIGLLSTLTATAISMTVVVTALIFGRPRPGWAYCITHLFASVVVLALACVWFAAHLV